MAWRLALFIAAGLVAGLAAAWVGVRLLFPPPMPAQVSTPQAPPAAAPAVGADVPPAPAAAPASLADIQRLTSDFEQTRALYHLAGRLGVAGVERLLDEADAIERPSERGAATSILYARYADLDPAAALRHVLARGAAANRWLVAVFHTWARIDLAAALRGVEILTANQRIIAGAAILQSRDDLPPAAQAELAARLSPQGERSASAVVALTSDGQVIDAPAHIWRLALQQQGETRRGGLHQAVAIWAQTDARAALDAIESADGVDRETRTHLREQAVWYWASTEPRAALEWAMAWPDAQARRALVRDALSGWASKDPRTAAQWLSAHAEPKLRDDALSTVAMHYADHHAEEAVDWLLSVSPDDHWPVESLFWTLADDNPERAAGLLARIADADARAAAERALVRSWAEADPNAAMAWLDRLADADPARREALTSTLLAKWAEHDIAGAMRHLDRLADAETHDATVLAMIYEALDFDVSLAESLFERLQTEDARREGADALHEHLADADPARAARYR